MLTRTYIDDRLDAMEKICDIFSNEVNATMTHFNSTIEMVQENVKTQVKGEVDLDMHDGRNST